MLDNIEVLRASLCEVFDDLRSGKIKPKEAKEVNNSAGKIIGTLKVQLEYHSLRSEKPSIVFLNHKSK